MCNRRALLPKSPRLTAKREGATGALRSELPCGSLSVSHLKMTPNTYTFLLASEPDFHWFWIKYIGPVLKRKPQDLVIAVISGLGMSQMDRRNA